MPATKKETPAWTPALWDSLGRLARYGYEAEAADYQQMLEAGEIEAGDENHIFTHIERLTDCLEGGCEATGTVIPKGSRAETDIIAAIALAAQQYADPSSLLETLALFSPKAAQGLREGLAERDGHPALASHTCPPALPNR